MSIGLAYTANRWADCKNKLTVSESNVEALINASTELKTASGKSARIVERLMLDIDKALIKEKAIIQYVRWLYLFIL